MMDPSNAKDIIPSQADEKRGGQDDSSGVVVRVRLGSSPSYNRRRRHGRRHQRDVTRDTHKYGFKWKEGEVNWRKSSQPRNRRLLGRFGLEGTTSTTSTETSTEDNNASTYESSSESLSGSNLRDHFTSLDKSAVQVFINERIKRVEFELEKLRAEREKLLKELEDEEVDEQWEDGVLAIDDLMGL